jgi:hypothetical protein
MIDPAYPTMFSTAVSGLVAVAIPTLAIWLNSKLNSNHADLTAKNVALDKKVDEVVHNTDGVMSKLEAALEGKGIAEQGQSRAEGINQGRADVRAENKEDAKR